MKVVYYL